ncbi:hypothetical protein [Adhaeribacter radiodurans]|uniref:Uncharacterized protein n=1 Tax=Adhaeribacter radiodurans TaxID=2745197 RepID=A0A7L7L3C2_9BACT|nr:hypothetical protein [Adhaeribacter radiodurans]QMU26929.1 hypothetical protein HUW48_02270 [Adhaeribacter radiodurans]
MKTRKTQEKPSSHWREKIITGIKAIAFLSAVFELVKGIYTFLKDIGVF